METLVSNFKIAKIIRSQKNGHLVLVCITQDLGKVLRTFKYDKRKNSKFQRLCKTLDCECPNKDTFNSDQFYFEFRNVAETNEYIGYLEPSGNEDHPYNIDEIFLAE